MILNCEWKNLEIHSTQRRREASSHAELCFGSLTITSSRFQSRMLDAMRQQSRVDIGTESEKIFTCFSCFEVFSLFCLSLLSSSDSLPPSSSSSHSHSSQQVHLTTAPRNEGRERIDAGLETRATLAHNSQHEIKWIFMQKFSLALASLL